MQKLALFVYKLPLYQKENLKLRLPTDVVH